MTVSTTGLILLALAAGGAGALTGVAVQSLGDEPTVSADATLASELAGLRQQLSSMQLRNDQLTQRLTNLELSALSGGPAESAPTPIFSSPEVVADLQAQVAQLSRVITGSEDGGGYDLEQLDAALEVLRARDDAEREKQREEQRAQMLEERLADLAKELGLNNYQTDQLATLAGEAATARDKVMDEIRESGNWDGMRDAMETLRTDMDARLTGFLTADQMAGFEKLGGMRSLGGRGGFGGFGGGGFGGFGGGGRGGRGGGGGGGDGNN